VDVVNQESGKFLGEKKKSLARSKEEVICREGKGGKGLDLCVWTGSQQG
jgi:hypothetical protein